MSIANGILPVLILTASIAAIVSPNRANAQSAMDKQITAIDANAELSTPKGPWPNVRASREVHNYKQHLDVSGQLGGKGHELRLNALITPLGSGRAKFGPELRWDHSASGFNAEDNA